MQLWLVCTLYIYTDYLKIKMKPLLEYLNLSHSVAVVSSISISNTYHLVLSLFALWLAVGAFWAEHTWPWSCQDCRIHTVSQSTLPASPGEGAVWSWCCPVPLWWWLPAHGDCIVAPYRHWLHNDCTNTVEENYINFHHILFVTQFIRHLYNTHSLSICKQEWGLAHKCS